MKNVALFSADERKWSIIAILLFLFSILAGWGYYHFGDISENLVNLITSGFYSLTGINVGNIVKNGVASWISGSSTSIAAVDATTTTSTSATSNTNYV